MTAKVFFILFFVHFLGGNSQVQKFAAKKTRIQHFYLFNFFACCEKLSKIELQIKNKNIKIQKKIKQKSPNQIRIIR